MEKKETKEKQVAIRWDETEVEELVREAAKEDRTFASYIRHLVKTHPHRAKKN